VIEADDLGVQAGDKVLVTGATFALGRGDVARRAERLEEDDAPRDGRRAPAEAA
jgi:hypothetical protein